jgi:hypothetical protein
MQRYNPQSIEKQVLCLFTNPAEQSLNLDYKARVSALLKSPVAQFPTPKIAIVGISSDILGEYGIDACRLARLSAPSGPVPYSLLESAYNWVSKFYQSFSQTGHGIFCEKPWLTALAQLPDHVINRDKPRTALALVQRAFNEARPSQSLSSHEKLCVITCILPFAPILGEHLLKTHGLQKDSINNIMVCSEQHMLVSLRIGNGGLHKEIVNKDNFSKDPMAELLKIKWVAKALARKPATLRDFAGGKQIVFTHK